MRIVFFNGNFVVFVSSGNVLGCVTWRDVVWWLGNQWIIFNFNWNKAQSTISNCVMDLMVFVMDFYRFFINITIENYFVSVIELLLKHHSVDMSPK